MGIPLLAPDRGAALACGDSARCTGVVARPLYAVTLTDLQAFVDSLGHLAQLTRPGVRRGEIPPRWAQRAGYLPLNV